MSNELAPTPIPKSVIEILRRPLPPEAIKPHPTKKFLSTIKAIYAVERLNEAFGLNGWKIKNELVELHETTHPATGKVNTMVVMKSFLTVPQYGIEVEAYGGNDNEDRGDAYKGACTDALTKICSYIYVGMDVYKGIKSNAGEVTGGSQAAADKMADTKLKAMAAGAKPRDVSDLLREQTIAAGGVLVHDPNDETPQTSEAHTALMAAFRDIFKRFERLKMQNFYYDHLRKFKVNRATQFIDDEMGLAAAQDCFTHMNAELSELEIAAKKATE